MTTSRDKKQREAALNPTLIPCSLDRERIGRKCRNAIADAQERDRERRLNARFV